MHPSPIRVLVVEDHPLFRDAIVLHLQRTGRVEVVATVASVQAARAHVGPVDLVVTDLHLTDGRGDELVDEVAVPVLVLSADERPGVLAGVRASGAAGMLSKTDATGPGLMQAIDRVLDGGTLFDEQAAESRLTRRERDVLRLIAEGRTTASAADELGLSPDTVRTYVDRIFKKLAAGTRAEAVTRATALGEI